MTDSARNPRSWPPAVLLRYGLAPLTVAMAGALIYGAELLGADESRVVLLVAVAVTALYAGLGPAILALGLSVLIAPSPTILLAGAALALVCATFYRARPGGQRQASRKAKDRPSGRPEPTQRAATPVSRFSSAGDTATPPPFVELTTEATWRFHHEQPLDITLPEDEQVEHLYLYSVLAECNDAFARMYGFRTAGDVVGTRLVVFLPPSDPENVGYLRRFIRSGYRLEDAESHEIDRYGNAKYFVNNLVGIFERGQLVGAWGTQRDVTATRERAQEYRSRIHSSKSSSQ